MNTYSISYFSKIRMKYNSLEKLELIILFLKIDKRTASVLMQRP